MRIDLYQADIFSIVLDVIEATASCMGTLKAWADGALIFDSSLGSNDFVIPPDYHKFSVQCYANSSDISINLSFDEEFSTDFKCVQVLI